MNVAWNFPKTILAGAITFALAVSVLVPNKAEANSALQGEMQRMFGSMSNASKPGVFETSRRGVISGGSLMVRNKVMDTNIIAWQPPSYNAGCGGIDLFGGSFSFINKEQFVQLARSIASNAASYAFYLALEAMSPPVRAIIDNIQKKIQELNQFFGNSCQLAQGIVNDAASAFGYKRDVDGAKARSFIGGFDDVFGSFTSSSGSAPTQNVPSTEEKRIKGNIVWAALKTKGVGGWFTNGGDTLNLAIMTATGTVIVGEEVDAPDGKGKAPVISYVQGSGIKLRDLVNGGKVRMLSCGSDTTNCMEPSKSASTEADIKGFKQMVIDVLNGDSSTNGVLKKIRSNSGLTEAEKKFVANLPDSAGAMVFRLSRVSEEVASNFIIEISEPLGRDMAYLILDSFMEAAIIAVQGHQDLANAKEALESMKKSRSEMMLEHQALVTAGMKMSDIMSKYNAILNAANAAGVTPSFATAPASSFQ